MQKSIEFEQSRKYIKRQINRQELPVRYFIITEKAHIIPLLYGKDFINSDKYTTSIVCIKVKDTLAALDDMFTVLITH